MSDIEGGTHDMARTLEKIRQSLEIVALLATTSEERLAEEERRAWDRYCSMTANVTSSDLYMAAPLGDRVREHYEAAAQHADLMLELRRKRFGASKEAGVMRRVPVDVEVLGRVIETLGEVDTIRSEALRATLRALVSE